MVNFKNIINDKHLILHELNLHELNANNIIFILLILLFIICIYQITINNTVNSMDVNEGFSTKIKEFMERKKEKNYKEGTQLNKIIDGLKHLDMGNKKLKTTLFSTKDNEYENEYENEKNSKNNSSKNNSVNNLVKYDKSGSNVSSNKMKSSIQEYYNKFNDEKFTKDCDTTYKSLKKFKHFKDEFYNLFKEF